MNYSSSYRALVKDSGAPYTSGRAIIAALTPKPGDVGKEQGGDKGSGVRSPRIHTTPFCEPEDAQALLGRR